MPIPEMDDAPGGWYETPKIRRPGYGSAKASRQIHKETQRRRGRRKEDLPRRHEEERRKGSEEGILMASDFLLLRFLLRVFVPLW
jgi:hypothetical protein